MYDIETLKIMQVNKAAMMQYGYSEAELLSMNISDLIAPGDKQYATKQLLARAGMETLYSAGIPSF